MIEMLSLFMVLSEKYPSTYYESFSAIKSAAFKDETVTSIVKYGTNILKSTAPFVLYAAPPIYGAIRNKSVRYSTKNISFVDSLSYDYTMISNRHSFSFTWYFN